MREQVRRKQGRKIKPNKTGMKEGAGVKKWGEKKKEKRKTGRKPKREKVGRGRGQCEVPTCNPSL